MSEDWRNNKVDFFGIRWKSDTLLESNSECFPGMTLVGGMNERYEVMN